MPLLLLHAEFPLLCDFHVVVLQPDQVLSVAPVTGKYLVSDCRLLPPGLILINIPVFLAIDYQIMQPAAFDVAYLLLNILQLLQLCNLSGPLAIEKFRGGIRVFNWLTLINHSCQLVLAAALRFAEEASLLVGGEDDDCLPIVC